MQKLATTKLLFYLTLIANLAALLFVFNFATESFFSEKFLSCSKKQKNLLFQADGRFNFSFQLYGAIPNLSCPHRTGGVYYLREDGEYEPPKQQQQQFEGGGISIGREIAGLVETSILFDFSPLVNNHVTKMFAREVSQEKWFTPHPFQVSCLIAPEKNDTLHCAVRVWFRLERFHMFLNRFQDSFVYLLEIDAKNLSYVPKSGRIAGIPSPINILWYTGPEDPRLIALNGSIFLNFINAHSEENNDNIVRHQFLWSLGESILYDIEVDDYPLNDIEKNWSPMITVDSATNASSLYFIYQLLPVTRVLQCQSEDGENQFQYRQVMKCSFIIGEPGDYNKKVKTSTLLLRGGSPFVKYLDNYYIAVTHSVQWLGGGKVYAAQLTLFNYDTSRVVFVSSPIFVHPQKMTSLPRTDPTVVRPFFYARSVYVETNDSLIIAGGVNDAEAFIVRLRGVATILQEAIGADRNLWEGQLSYCQSAIGTTPYDQMLFSAYTSLEDWIRKKNLEQLERIWIKKSPGV